MTVCNADATKRAAEPAGGQSEVKDLLAKYRRAHWPTSVFQVASSVTLYLAAWLLMWWSLSWPYAATLLLAVPTAGLLVRIFILQHDCGHGSLFASRGANRLVGTLLSALTMTPYECWRRQHALHHATNGQLDHRGTGDVRTITVDEYANLSRWERWKYRAYRHPLLLFGVGPFLYFIVQQRFTWGLPESWKRERRNVHLTNALLVALGALLCWLIGPWALVKVHLPVTLLAGSCGVWLFYVQHQFETSYWQHDATWDHHRAAIEGSSYLELPWLLRWMTANIGFHHIHHLDSRIPNYALPVCYRAHPQLQVARRFTLWSAVTCMRLKLWDERSQRLVSFRQARHLRGQDSLALEAGREGARQPESAPVGGSQGR